MMMAALVLKTTAICTLPSLLKRNAMAVQQINAVTKLN